MLILLFILGLIVFRTSDNPVRHVKNEFDQKVSAINQTIRKAKELHSIEHSLRNKSISALNKYRKWVGKKAVSEAKANIWANFYNKKASLQYTK